VSDLNGRTTSPEFLALIVGALKSMGYSVAVNDPYAGNVLIGRHGNPARGIDSVQIEVNKKLFMDTQTFRATPGLTKLKSDIDKLLGVVAEDTRKRLRC
jgi:N-formylglutamate deformylase